MSVLWYDRQGRPVSIDQIEELLSDPSYKIVRRYEADGWLVSTVWLGLDHRLLGGGPPLIFETMVFAPGYRQDWMPEEYCERYPTEDAAIAGHDRALAWLADLRGVGEDDLVADALGDDQDVVGG